MSPLHPQFPELPDMSAELWRLVGQIPPGRVTTYGTLGTALGNRMATRWLATVLLHHEHTPECGCHRVVRAGGEFVDSAANSAAEQAARLQAEGVAVSARRVDLLRYGFSEFTGPQPLAALAAFQQEARAHVSLETRVPQPELVAGIDVSYGRHNLGVAAYALVQAATGEVVFTHTVKRTVTFPYISTFLTFREVPLYMDLLDDVRRLGRLADVLLVDGTGILHPLQAGIASTFGVVADLPTVGVAKKLLCGSVDLQGMAAGELRPVEYQGQVLGMALRHRAKSARPLFVSPGQYTSVPDAAALAQRLLFGHRLPEPIYWADRLSRAEVKS